MAMPIQIGDAIALAQLCYNIAQAFGTGRKAAPSEFRDLQNELYNLTNILQLLESSVEGGAITTSENGPPGTSQAAQCVTRMLSDCRDTVNHLKVFAKRYAPLAGVELVDERSGVKVKKIVSKGRILHNWKRIMWTTETSNIQGIRDRISIHVQSINLVVSLVTANSTASVQEGVRILSQQVQGQQMELQTIRGELQGVHLGLSMANSNIQNVHANLQYAHHDLHSNIQTVRQDIHSMGQRMETIVAWQQRDMQPTQALQQQISNLMRKIDEQSRNITQPRPGHPLPYPDGGNYLAMPHANVISMQQTHTHNIYGTTNQSTPNFPIDVAQTSHRHVPTRSITEFSATYASATVSNNVPVELPTREVSRRRRTVMISSVQSSAHIRHTSPARVEPVEIDSETISEPEPARPPRKSRATATDVTFELLLRSETRIKDNILEFAVVCENASFHGNWMNAVKGSEYNLGLFLCLCEPYPDEEDDFVPHAEDIEDYYLTDFTIGCHFHGNVQWIIHNIGHMKKTKFVTLGIGALDAQKEILFDKNFMGPISFKAARNTLSGGLPSGLIYKTTEARDRGGYEDEESAEVEAAAEDKDMVEQLAVLNSMADDSFGLRLEHVTFALQSDSDPDGEKFTKSGIKAANMLHYKTIDVTELQPNNKFKRDTFKYLDHVELEVRFSASRGRPTDLESLRLFLNEWELDSNESIDESIVTLEIKNGNVTYARDRRKVNKMPGTVEFKFRTPQAASLFLRRLKDMRNELHTLKIQHAKREESVMVKLFAEHITAADDIRMSGVEIAVVWDAKRKKGRILARSRDGSCHLSQILHRDFFERFAELSRRNLFHGSAEFYTTTNVNPGSDRVRKYPHGVGRLNFQDPSNEDIFYARLTESARRFKFNTTARETETVAKSSTQPDDRPILQRRVTQTGKSRNWRFSTEHYKRIVQETSAIEDMPPAMVAALPQHNLTRPLDAEELLDLLDQTEERMLYTMESVDAADENNYMGDIMVPSHPSDLSDAALSMRKRDRNKSNLNHGTDIDTVGESVKGSSGDQSNSPTARPSPQTSKTTPDIVSPEQSTSAPMRRSASADFSKMDRDLDSQKVLLPYDMNQKFKKDLLSPDRGAVKHRRSLSANNRTSPWMLGSQTDDNSPKVLSVQPPPRDNPISDTSDLVNSPETYGDNSQPDRANIPSISSSLRTGTEQTDHRDVEETLYTKEEPLDTQEDVDNQLQESVKDDSPPDDIPDSMALPHGTSSLTLPIAKTETTIRAYRLINDFDTDLNKGALLWLDEAHISATRRGSVSVRVIHYENANPEGHIYIPRTHLKQTRYYKMKRTKTLKEGGEKLKIWKDEIVVPLDDEDDLGEDEEILKVVPLTQGFSMPVEKDLLQEVNLTMIPKTPQDE